MCLFSGKVSLIGADRDAIPLRVAQTTGALATLTQKMLVVVGRGRKHPFTAATCTLNEVKKLQSFTLKTLFMKLPQGTFQKLDARASVPTFKDGEEFATAWH